MTQVRHKLGLRGDLRERVIMRIAHLNGAPCDVHVPAPRVDAVRAQLGDRQWVELVGTIASYNMVSRLLEALHILKPCRLTLTAEATG
jgi:alkylhydroperoxidase family enzyme